MRKITLLIGVIILIVLPGCLEKNNSGDYSDFVKREGQIAGQKSDKASSLRIYGVFPSEVSTKGMERIRIYGAGFEKGTKVFLQNPEYEIEAYVINPGTLEVWMPPRHEGMFIIGVKNSNKEIVRWSRLLKYTEKN